MLHKDVRTEKLATAPVWPLLASFSWPALVTMTLNALYNVVDRFYIGQGCGMDAIAGLTLTFPLMMVFGAFGVLIGAGSGSLLSIKLGERNRIDAEKTLGQCVAFKLILGFVVTPIIWFFLDAILSATGGSGVSSNALHLAKEYLQIVLIGQPFAHLAFGLANCIRSEGSPRQSMTCMVVGAAVNIVLDPIFIFVFKWGVVGAAWATNAAMASACFCALYYYFRGRSVVKLCWQRIRVYPALAAAALGIGLAPFLQTFTGAAINFSMNYAFAKWAASPANATVAIASFGIFQTVAMMCLMPLFGVQQGLGPIVGYNWGAKNLSRVAEVFSAGLKATCIFCALACIIQVFGANLWVRCFADSAQTDLLRVGARDLRLANCMLWTIGLNVAATTFYQSTGRPRVAILLSLLRQVICLLPCVWILPYIFADHTFGIWLALPASDTLCCLATIPVLIKEFRTLKSSPK